MQIRLGLPTSFRKFSEAARALGAPILVSANAFRRAGGSTFSLPSADLFSGVPVALDSAGFVAHHCYGGFPWSVKEYIRLAASYPWDWYASMDLCCEPEIASNREEVRRRQQETIRLLGACREEANRQGIAPPMPVLQGWRATDYLRFAEAMTDLPSLVGLGSVCRRSLSGPSGLLSIIERLDRSLPRGVRLHLFGVKGTAIQKLAGHPRIHSVDSMAWDFQARKAAALHQHSNTLEHRIHIMRRWYTRQIETLPQQAGGKDTAKDVGGAFRQRLCRDRRKAQGQRQINLWMNETNLDWLDGQREEGEHRSSCLNRLLETMQKA